MRLADKSPASTTAWFLVLTIPAIGGSYLLMLEGYHLILDGVVQTGVSLSMAAVIFVVMTTVALLISLVATTSTATKLQREFIGSLQDHPGDLSIGFFLGFIGWQAFVALGQTKAASMLAVTVPTLPLSATLSATQGNGLNEVQSLYVNTIVAPPAEELFFGAATPIIVLGIVSLLIVAGIPYLSNFLRNDWVQIGLMTLIPSVAFATFHTQAKVFSGFWIFAFVFSIFLKGIVYADSFENAIPSVALLGSFSVGTHLGNNFYRAGGFFDVMTQLMAEPVLFMSAGSIFAIYGLLAFMRITEFVPLTAYVRQLVQAVAG